MEIDDTATQIILAACWAGAALVAWALGDTRGRRSFGWRLYSVALAPFALLHFAISIGDPDALPFDEREDESAGGGRRYALCPGCAKVIAAGTHECPHCHRDLVHSEPSELGAMRD